MLKYAQELMAPGMVSLTFLPAITNNSGQNNQLKYFTVQQPSILPPLPKTTELLPGPSVF